MAQWRKVVVSGSTAELNHISASGNIIPVTADGGTLGSQTLEWSDLYLADSSVMNFGADQDTTLTHIPDIALRLNSTRGLQFRDGALNISSSADGELDINADGKISITTPALSASNDLWVGGDIHAVGNVTFQAGASGTINLGDNANDNVIFGADISSSIIPDKNDSFDLGSTGQRWNDVWVSGSITANGGAHSLTSATTIDIDADGALTIDGGSITIGGDADVAVDFDASTFDLDASGALTIDSATSISLGTAADVAWDVDTSTLDIDASGAVTIDTSAGGVSVDAAAASNFTTAAGALTLNGAGGVNIAGNSSEVDITTSGAVDINSGAFTVNGSTVGIDGSSALTMGATEMDIDADGGAIDIDATTTITIGGTNATAVTVGKSDTTVTIPGSLDVNGSLTTIDTTNLRVADRFIQLASGSTTGDGGIIVTTAANGSGSAMFWDDSALRWGLTGDGETGDSQLSAVPRQYITSVSQSAASPSGNPSNFGADAATRRGMMYIQTADDASTLTVAGDIWIWS
jgi:hypothetical protein